jgi:nitroreductase
MNSTKIQNETLKAIKTRRSIRSYKPEQIRQEELDAILEAAIYAPSAMNQQPWHFTVIRDQKLLDHISVEVSKSLDEIGDEWWAERKTDETKPPWHLFYHAPTVVLISGRVDAKCPLIDCSAASENMMLAAESMGIGSCWIGLIHFFLDKEEAASVLDVPDGYRPYYAICLGYNAKEHPEPPARVTEGVVSYME